jgi:PAS domain S-box-containing protein
MYGKTDKDLFSKEQADAMHEDEQLAISTRHPLECEELVTTHGEKRTYFSIKFPLFHADGTPLAVCGVTTDITDRKLSEAALKQSEAKYRRLYNETPIMLHSIDRDARVVDVNDYWLETMGYERDEVIGRNVNDFYTEASGKYAREVTQPAFFRDGFAEDISYQFVKKNGEVLDVLLSATAERDASGRVIRSQAVIENITESKRDEEARARLTVAIEQAGETVLITDAEGAIQYVNPMFETVTGYSRTEAIGRNPRILKSGKHDHAFYRDLWHTIRSGRVWQGRFINRKKDGSLFTEDATISPVLDTAGRIVNFVAVKRDVTEHLRAVEEKNRLEEQLQQSQKMESIGTLAGGIAHDFNNILTAIIGYGNLALMKMAADDPQRLNIEQMLDAANRAAYLTKDLLLFSRRQIGERKPIDLNDVIRKVETFLKRVIGEDIECRATPFAGTLPILGDAHQLEQVMMNLATNARDAMPEGGIFSITTERVNCNNEVVSAEGAGTSGDCALITISDTGVGMEEATREHIFEPFFTTKEVGKGTGLGLAVVYGIITQHQGTITVYSEPGQGTTFEIHLPLTTELEHEMKADEAELMVGGTETILLAEDDNVVRDLTRTVLADFGYTVIVAHDGQDAVDKYKENREKIRLLLLDVIMPKKTGQQAYDEIKAMAPGIKVIFVSGYARDVVHQRALIDEGMPVVNKPISPRALLTKVREMLDRP